MVGINSIINPSAPDFNFVILSNEGSQNYSDLVQWSLADQRLKSVGSIRTVLDMNALASVSLEIIDPSIYFCPDFPEFLLPLENPEYKAAPQVVPSIITWGTVRKEPGTVGGKMFTGTQEIKPRFREALAVFGDQTKQWVVTPTTSDLESFGGLVKYIKIKAQVFDNLVQYNIWSKSNFEVEKLTEWFEEYMENYRGMFREAGINELIFNRRVRDDTLMAMNNGYHVRSVLYYVRTERVLFETALPIDRINVKVYVNDLNEVQKSLTDHNIDTNLYDRIISKWVNKK
jgi:hypothetical protein